MVALLATSCSDKNPVAASDPGVLPEAGSSTFPSIVVGESSVWARVVNPVVRAVKSFAGSPLQVMVSRSPDLTSATLTFEGGADNTFLPTQVPDFGANFNDWLSLVDVDAGGSGDFSNQPSGTTVGFWGITNQACLTGKVDKKTGLSTDPCALYRDIDLARPARRVSLDYTSFVPVTLTAYAGNEVVKTVTGARNYTNGTNPPGQTGTYVGWSQLVIDTTADVITRIRIQGYIQATGIDNLSVTRRNLPPVPELPGLIEVNEGTSVTFDASRSQDPEDGTTGLTYAWDFGNGNTATGPQVTRTYPDNTTTGSYPATLTVTDQNGKSASAATVVNVANVAPQLSSVPTIDVDAQVPLAYTLSFTDPGTDSWTATVDYDTNSAADAIESQTLAGRAITLGHLYPSGGTYTVSVTVRDDDGATDTRTYQVKVGNAPLTMGSVSGATLDEGGTYNATVTFTDADVGPWPVTVDYGDGTPVAHATVASHAFSLSHPYTDDGSYAVKVSIDDGDVNVERVATVTVNNLPPTATLVAPASVIQDEPLTLTVTGVTDPSPADVAAGFSYAFDCGSGYGAFGTASSASCPTAVPGSRTVGARVKDKDGGTTQDAKSVNVIPSNDPVVLSGPVAGASLSEGGTYTASGSFTDADSGPWTLTVSYGDSSTPVVGSTTSRAFSLTHAYADDGTFTVKVSVSDGQTRDSTQAVVVVDNVAPTATFNAPATIVQNGALALSLTGASDPSPIDQAGLTYAFDCGQGSGYGSFSMTPSALCPATVAGPRTVKAAVRDKDGGSSEYVRSVSVTPANPAPLVTASAVASSVPCVAGVGQVKLLGTATDADALQVGWYEGSTLKSSQLSPTLLLPLGAHTLQLRATEQRTGGSTSTADVAVTVADNSAPVVSVSASTSAVWPANRAYRAIAVTAKAADLCTLLVPNNTLAGYVQSNEADDAPGSGDGGTVGDIRVTHLHAGNTVEVSSNSHPQVSFHRGDKLDVRAERAGSTARVYTIFMSASDGGGTGQASATVRVTQGQGQGDDDRGDDKEHDRGDDKEHDRGDR